MTSSIRNRRTQVAMVGLLLILRGPAQAAAVHLEAEPGGAQVLDADDGNRMVASAGGTEDRSVLDFDAAPAATHHFVLQRPPYLPINLVLHWEPMVGSWQVDSPGQPMRVLRGPTPPWEFSRQFHLNVEPDSVTAVAHRGAAEIPLVHTSDGELLVPAAYHAFTLHLSAPGYLDRDVSFVDGQMNAPDASLPLTPIRLVTRYGPFSNSTFDFCLLLGLCGLGGIGVWARRHQLEAQRRDASLSTLQAEFAAMLSTAAGEPRTEFTHLQGTTLHSDHGMGYVLIRLIGQGGMGAVFEAALETDPHASYAVKIMSCNAAVGDARKRFERELQSCARLQHPGLVKVIDWGLEGADPQPPFIVFERLTGRTLREMYRAKGLPLPVERAVDLVIDILKALASAHQGRVIHRDLKPENVMILDSGRIKVIDFGIAHVVGHTMTASAAAMGTPCYMSPEHFHANRVVAASDVYSVGIILYEMVSAQVPFNASDWYGLMGQILYGQQVPLRDAAPGTPPELCRIVDRMLDCELSKRYASCADALRDLEAFRQAGADQ